MVVCERPGFWRWMIRASVGAVRAMPRELVGAVRAVPGMVRGIRMPRIREAIREPFCEFYTGMMAIVVILTLQTASDLTLTTRLIIALLIIPSFLLAMHGTYRKWGDC